MDINLSSKSDNWFGSFYVIMLRCVMLMCYMVMNFTFFKKHSFSVIMGLIVFLDQVTVFSVLLVKYVKFMKFSCWRWR